MAKVTTFAILIIITVLNKAVSLQWDQNLENYNINRIPKCTNTINTYILSSKVGDESRLLFYLIFIQKIMEGTTIIGSDLIKDVSNEASNNFQKLKSKIFGELSQDEISSRKTLITMDIYLKQEIYKVMYSSLKLSTKSFDSKLTDLIETRKFNSKASFTPEMFKEFVNVEKYDCDSIIFYIDQLIVKYQRSVKLLKIGAILYNSAASTIAGSLSFAGSLTKNPLVMFATTLNSVMNSFVTTGVTSSTETYAFRKELIATVFKMISKIIVNSKDKCDQIIKDLFTIFYRYVTWDDKNKDDPFVEVFDYCPRHSKIKMDKHTKEVSVKESSAYKYFFDRYLRLYPISSYISKKMEQKSVSEDFSVSKEITSMFAVGIVKK